MSDVNDMMIDVGVSPEFGIDSVVGPGRGETGRKSPNRPAMHLRLGSLPGDSTVFSRGVNENAGVLPVDFALFGFTALKDEERNIALATKWQL